MEYQDLSSEQQMFINAALSGSNILVDACIGSGKTTAIQTLCSMYGGKSILYLTYNKLLKLDAVAKIKVPNVTVTNYHGFAWSQLARIGVRTSVSDMVQAYNHYKPKPPYYQVLVLDEYQDVEQELADMLWHIKNSCHGIQIVAVGDMAQKIYDKTRLDVSKFILEFLGPHIDMEFTRCFRINASHAAMLGRIWGKTIIGVNDACRVRTMSDDEAKVYASKLKPSEILVLGSNAGERAVLQNYLEKMHSDVFNYNTIWSKLSDSDSTVTSPRPDCAIFTTYDGCKGMERDVCFVYDWKVNYWENRLSKSEARYEIIRNIFCVAASRGKREIIFVDGRRKSKMLTESVLSVNSTGKDDFSDMQMSVMFDFKFIEDVEDAYHMLSIEEKAPISDVISAPLSYGLVDLSRCIGIYAKCCYFPDYDIDTDIWIWQCEPGRESMYVSKDSREVWSLFQKIQYLCMLETMQRRYYTSVPSSIVSQECEDKIISRFSDVLPDNVPLQEMFCLSLYDGCEFCFVAKGICDAVYDGELWLMKFVEEISHVHCLHMAMLLLSSGYKYGNVVNIRTGQHLRISIPDPRLFMKKAVYAATKGRLCYAECDPRDYIAQFQRIHTEACREFVDKYVDNHPDGTNFVKDFMDDHKLQLLVPESVFADAVLVKDTVPLVDPDFEIPKSDSVVSDAALDASSDQATAEPSDADTDMDKSFVSLESKSKESVDASASADADPDAKPIPMAYAKKKPVSNAVKGTVSNKGGGFSIRKKLQDAILNGSKSNSIARAIREWSIQDVTVNYANSGVCLCGQRGIHFEYGIVNEKTGVYLYPIGSECIKKFKRGDFSDYASGFEECMRIAESMHHGSLCGVWMNPASGFSVDDSTWFSKKLLRFLYKEGCFKATVYNDYDPVNDLEFCIDMFNTGTHWGHITDKQRGKIAVMNRMIGKFIMEYYVPIVDKRMHA